MVKRMINFVSLLYLVTHKVILKRFEEFIFFDKKNQQQKSQLEIFKVKCPTLSNFVQQNFVQF